MVKKQKKSAVVYAQLAFFLGLLGIHKFYAERFTQAFTMLALFLGSIICLAIAGLDVMIWTWVDFIVGLCNANNPDRLFNK